MRVHVPQRGGEGAPNSARGRVRARGRADHGRTTGEYVAVVFVQVNPARGTRPLEDRKPLRGGGRPRSETDAGAGPVGTGRLDGLGAPPFELALLLCSSRLLAAPSGGGLGAERCWSGGAVAVDGVDGLEAGVGDAEVGSVAAERLLPDCSCLVGALGDEVGDVVVPAAGHGDVRRRRRGRFAHEEMGFGLGVALGAVDGGGVSELDRLPRVPDRDVAGPAVVVAQPDGFVADGGDGPGLSVGDAELSVVAAGCDPVPEPEMLTRLVHDDTVVVDEARGDQSVADRGVERRHVLATVGHQGTVGVSGQDRLGCSLRECVDTLRIASVELDLPAPEQGIEDRLTIGSLFAAAYRQADRRVLGIGEPVHDVKTDDGFWAGVLCGKVDHAAATDSRERPATVNDSQRLGTD